MNLSDRGIRTHSYNSKHEAHKLATNALGTIKKRETQTPHLFLG